MKRRTTSFWEKEFLEYSVSRIKSLIETDDSNILEECKRRILDPKSMRNEKRRIIIVKILVAFYPKSIDVIRMLLSNVKKDVSFEIHFTIFCYLDQIFTVTQEEKYHKIALDMVKDYLLRIKKDMAMAGWMAGDLLGSHWADKKQSERALFIVLSKSHYIAGKIAALHGIQHVISSSSLEKKNKIRKKLFSIMRKEKSREVLDELKFTLISE